MICMIVAFPKFRKMNFSFIMSVRPSISLYVCPPVRIEQLGSHCSDVLDIWYLSIYRKFVEKIQVSLKSDKNNGVLYIEVYIVRLW